MSNNAVEPESAKPTAQPVTPTDEDKLKWIDPHRRFDNNWWRIKRSRFVDRTRLDGIDKRIELYDRLQNVLAAADDQQTGGSDVAQSGYAGSNVEKVTDASVNPIAGGELSTRHTHVPNNVSKCSTEPDRDKAPAVNSPILDEPQTSIESTVANKHCFELSGSGRGTSAECLVSALDSGAKVQAASGSSPKAEADLVDISNSSGHSSLGDGPTKLEQQEHKELGSSFLKADSKVHFQKLEPISMLDPEINSSYELSGARARTGSKDIEHPPQSLGRNNYWSNEPCVDSGQPSDVEHPFDLHDEYSIKEWKLAAEFNASLGEEMAQFRQEIEAVMSEHPEGTLFPVELMTDYHSKFGRRINNCVQDFSAEGLYAWLRCFSSLDISRLIL